MAATEAPTSPTATSEISHRQVLVIFSGLMLGMLLAALDQTIVATALPTIVGDVGGLDHLAWVVTAYLLATTVSTPIYGKLGDLYGRKRLFQIAIVIFLAGSVLCGLASTMGQLIAFRFLQGLGAGGLLVGAQAIIADVVSPRERGRYQGFFGAVFGAASVAGPLLGGFFTDQLTWRWVFYVNIPLGLAALAVTSIVLPRSQRRQDVVIDVTGSVLLTLAITCIVLVTTWGGNDYAWSSPVIVGLIASAAVLVAAFGVVERRAAEPVLPLRLFAGRTFNLASGISFIVGMAMFGVISFLPLFLQVATGASATGSGLLLVPLMAGLLTSSIISGQLITRTGRYRVFPIAGMAVASLGMVLLSTMGGETPTIMTSAYMTVVGVGIGMVMQVLVLATQNSVDVRDLGVATSSVSFFRSVGGSIGVALFGAVFTSRLAAELSGLRDTLGQDPGDLSPQAIQALPDGIRADYIGGFADALTGVFLLAVPLMLLGFGLTWLLRDVPLRTSTAASPAAPPAPTRPAEPGHLVVAPVTSGPTAD